MNLNSRKFGENVKIIEGDGKASRSIIAAVLTFGKLVVGRSMQYRQFWSLQAKRCIKESLSGDFDLIIVDHYITLSNVPLVRLMMLVVFHRVRLVFIGHNITPKAMFDAARLAPMGISKILFSLQAFQAIFIECFILLLSTKALFISSFDAGFYRFLGFTRVVNLFPILPDFRQSPNMGLTLSQGAASRAVVFLGSPKFAPNKNAIDWILGQFSATLYEIDPSIKIYLVGLDTNLIDHNRENVCGLGYVDEEQLERLLEGCSAFISPVTFGSGIKIKIMDAIAAACPVFATKQSLRGFEFMNFAPCIFPGDPQYSARLLAEFVSDTAAVIDAKASIRERWSIFTRGRSGMLVQTVLRDI